MGYMFPARALAPAAPWIVGISAVAATPTFDAGAVAVWIALHTVTLLFAAGVATLFREGVRWSGKKEVGVWWVLATGALAGAVKALSTASAEQVLGFSQAPTQALAARALGAVVVGVWLVTLVAFGRAALDRLDEARSSLIRQNVAKRLAEDAAVTRPEVTASKAVISTLRETLATRPRATSSADIRHAVDSTIRPLSRALWSVESKRYPPIKMVSLYRIALASFKMRAALVALVWTVTSFTGLAVSMGMANAAAYTISVGVLAFVLLSVVRLGWTQSVTVSVLAVAGASALAVSVGYQLSGLIFPDVLPLVGIPLQLTGVVWMTFVAIGAAIISGVLELRDVITRDLESAATKDLIEQRTHSDAEKATTRLLATELHGTIQSTLLGIAAALDRNAVDSEDVDRRLAAVLDDLELLGQHDTSGAPGHPSRQVTLADLIGGWEGIMTISCDDASRAQLSLLLSQAPESGEIIREALANAHRHGLATTVAITAAPQPDGYTTLTIRDNGYGPRSGPPGLGSALLDRWTGGQWSLRGLTDGGSELRVTVSPNEHQAHP